MTLLKIVNNFDMISNDKEYFIIFLYILLENDFYFHCSFM